MTQHTNIHHNERFNTNKKQIHIAGSSYLSWRVQAKCLQRIQYVKWD